MRDAIDVLSKLLNDLSSISNVKYLPRCTFEPRLLTLGQNNRRKLLLCNNLDQANCINLIVHFDKEVRLLEFSTIVEEMISMLKKYEPKKIMMIDSSCLVWQVVHELSPETLFTKYFHTFDELFESIVSQICESDLIETDQIEVHLYKMFVIYGSFFDPSYQLKILYSRFTKTLTHLNQDDQRPIILIKSNYVVFDSL